MDNEKAGRPAISFNIQTGAIQIAPVTKVVTLLHNVLELAECGAVTGVVVAFSLDGDTTGTAYEIGEGSSAAILNLALDRVKQRLAGPLPG